MRILTETVTSPTLAEQISILAEVPAGEVAPVRAGRARQRAGGARWRSAKPSTRCTTSRRPTSSSRSTPTSCVRARHVRVRARLRDGRRVTDGKQGDEPPVRRREHADRSPGTWPTTGCRCGRREIEASRRRSASTVGDRRQRRRTVATPTAQKWIAAVAQATCRRIAAAARGRRATTTAGGARARARDERRRSATSGTTVVYTDRSKSSPTDQRESLRELVAGMDAGAGRAARDPRRQPRVHRAGRPRVRRRAAKVGLRVHSRSVRRRDVGATATGTCQRRTSRELGRRPRLRRHGVASSSR